MLLPKRLRSLHALNLALALASPWLEPSPAHAAVALGADLEVDAPSDTDADTALAFAVRLGWQLQLPAIVFTPEVGYQHGAFGDVLTLDRAFAGARLGIGEVFRIGAFGHVGVGHTTRHAPDEGTGITDVTYDVGGFLDFTLLPLLDVGVHAGYGRMRAGDAGKALRWVPVGVHLALIF